MVFVFLSLAQIMAKEPHICSTLQTCPRIQAHKMSALKYPQMSPRKSAKEPYNKSEKVHIPQNIRQIALQYPQKTGPEYLQKSPTISTKETYNILKRAL